MLKTLRRLFGGAPATSPAPARPTPPPDPEPYDIPVPETDVAAVRALLEAGEPLLLLDVREPWEWAQAHLPAAMGQVRHIPMNGLPERVAELPRDLPIVVFCAHGSRSYSVTHWLREQGYDARNLQGGITRWAQSGGPTERGA